MAKGKGAAGPLPAPTPAPAPAPAPVPAAGPTPAPPTPGPVGPPGPPGPAGVQVPTADPWWSMPMKVGVALLGLLFVVFVLWIGKSLLWDSKEATPAQQASLDGLTKVVQDLATTAQKNQQPVLSLDDLKTAMKEAVEPVKKAVEAHGDRITKLEERPLLDQEKLAKSIQEGVLAVQRAEAKRREELDKKIEAEIALRKEAEKAEGEREKRIAAEAVRQILEALDKNEQKKGANQERNQTLTEELKARDQFYEWLRNERFQGRIGNVPEHVKVEGVRMGPVVFNNHIFVPWAHKDVVYAEQPRAVPPQLQNPPRTIPLPSNPPGPAFCPAPR